MQLSKLISATAVKEIKGTAEGLDIKNIQFDSRKVGVGDLFVATRGTTVDGHEFISNAIEQGAVAIVCEEIPSGLEQNRNITYIIVGDSQRTLGEMASAYFDNPSRKLILVGVTGTNGKTTIATLLYRLARRLGYRAGLLSTVCNYVEDKAIPSTHTTPDALALQELLHQMVESGCEYAFMEVSSHSIAQQRIAGLQFNGGIFTNLTRDHLDFHKTFENYRDTKKHFFDLLTDNCFAITNIDDENGITMVKDTKARVFTYSQQHLQADFFAQIQSEKISGMTLKINHSDILHTPLVGHFNVSNLLAIYSAALCLKYNKEQVLQELSTLSPVNGRFETIHSQKGWTAIVDYAHTPDAVENVINTIKEIKTSNGRLLTVIGCGGNRDKGKRPQMAQIAFHGSDLLILTSDNPRDENPNDILKDMLDGLTENEREQVLVIEDRAEAIEKACALAKGNDIVLVAGKGHENYQIIQGIKHHFDDHEQIRLHT